MYWTVNRQVDLLSGSDPLTILSQVAGAQQAPQLNPGDLVSSADPPVTAAGYTQVTNGAGTTGWVPTDALTAGVMSSTPVNAIFAIAILAGVYWGLRYISKS
jgi:hypothetical protein